MSSSSYYFLGGRPRLVPYEPLPVGM